MPQVAEEALKGLRSVLLELFSERIVAQRVPRMMDQFADVPKIVSQDRIRQWTFGQVADISFLQVVEEPVFQVFSKDRVLG